MAAPESQKGCMQQRQVVFITPQITSTSQYLLSDEHLELAR